jgi:hypothetical protein
LSLVIVSKKDGGLKLARKCGNVLAECISVYFCVNNGQAKKLCTEYPTNYGSPEDVNTQEPLYRGEVTSDLLLIPTSFSHPPADSGE